MKLHDELIGRGFILLESTARIYGKDGFTGSIENERKGKIIFMTPDDRIQEVDKEVFCPFMRNEDEKHANKKYQSVVLRSIEEIDKYIIDRI